MIDEEILYLNKLSSLIETGMHNSTKISFQYDKSNFDLFIG